MIVNAKILLFSKHIPSKYLFSFCKKALGESTRNFRVHSQNYGTVRVCIACQVQVFADIRDQPNYNKSTFYVRLAEWRTHLCNNFYDCEESFVVC